MSGISRGSSPGTWGPIGLHCGGFLSRAAGVAHGTRHPATRARRQGRSTLGTARQRLGRAGDGQAARPSAQAALHRFPSFQTMLVYRLGERARSPVLGCMWASLMAPRPAVSLYCRRCSSSPGIPLDHDRMRPRIGQARQIHGVDRAHTKHGFLTSGRRLQACRPPNPRECRLRVLASCQPSRGPKWSKAGSTRQTLI